MEKWGLWGILKLVLDLRKLFGIEDYVDIVIIYDVFGVNYFDLGEFSEVFDMYY